MGLISVESKCQAPDKRGDKTCVECYFSQVDNRNSWVGSQRCWRSACIAMDLNSVPVDQLARVVDALRESGCSTWREYLNR